MDMHHCTRLSATSGRTEASRLLRPFPVRLASTPNHPDGFVIHGMPGDFCFLILSHALGPLWAATATVGRNFCTCSVKTVIVPDGHIEDWKQAMDGSLFRPTAIRTSAPYLGIHVGTRAYGPPHPSGTWSPSQLNHIREESWAPAIAKVKSRTCALHGAASIGMRAAHTNIYITSPCTYAAAYCLPSKRDLKMIESTCSRFCCPAGTLPAHALSGLGTVYRLRGAPRRPLAQFQCNMLMASLRNDLQTPPLFPPRLAWTPGKMPPMVQPPLHRESPWLRRWRRRGAGQSRPSHLPEP